MAEELARADSASDPEPLLPSPRLLPRQAAPLALPYRNRFYRVVRLVGMACLLGSALGLLAGVAGLGINPFSMLGALVLSLGLIAVTVRPSLRRPKI